MNITDYISEERFLELFRKSFSMFGHISCCQNCSSRGFFHSKTYIDIQNRLKKNEVGIQDAPAWLNEFCLSRIGNDYDYFPVLFAAWYGMSERECRLIIEHNPYDVALHIINAFMCGKSYEQVY